MVTVAQFRKLALACDGASESEHMQHPDFRANGKIFATLQADGQRGMVKLTPAQQTKRVAAAKGALEPANGAWGKSGCTMVDLAAIDRTLLADLLTEAWQNTMA